MHCGAPLSDEALFCMKCGARTRSSVTARTTDDGQGIVIDAPEGPTVTITNDDEHSKVPDQAGEFVIASWEGTEASTEEKTKTVTKRPKGTKNTRKAPAKRSGLLSMIATVIKTAVIIVIVVVVIVFIKQMFKGKGPERQAVESIEQPYQEPVIPKDDDNGGVIVNDGGQEPANREGESTIDEEGVYRPLDDLPLEQRVSFVSSLMQRTEEQLQEELAKGDKADPAVVKECRDYIEWARDYLSNLKQ